jgi:hypothetical protein
MEITKKEVIDLMKYLQVEQGVRQKDIGAVLDRSRHTIMKWMLEKYEIPTADINWIYRKLSEAFKEELKTYGLNEVIRNELDTKTILVRLELIEKFLEGYIEEGIEDNE